LVARICSLKAEIRKYALQRGLIRFRGGTARFDFGSGLGLGVAFRQLKFADLGQGRVQLLLQPDIPLTELVEWRDRFLIIAGLAPACFEPALDDTPWLSLSRRLTANVARHSSTAASFLTSQGAAGGWGDVAYVVARIDPQAAGECG
jgi:hypothetical protein